MKKAIEICRGRSAQSAFFSTHQTCDHGEGYLQRTIASQLGSIIVVAILMGSFPLDAATLSVRILNARGSLTPARVYLTGADGRSYFAPDTIQYQKTRDGLSEDHFVPPTGTFAIDLPAGSYTLQIERGKEYIQVTAQVKVPSAGSVEKTFHLKRWVRMTKSGWYSGDMHVHAALKDVPVLMRAEDLNVALPVTMWRSTHGPVRRDPDLEKDLAKAGPSGVVRVGQDREFTLLNAELESYSSALIASRLGRSPVPLDFPMVPFGLNAQAQGALVDSEKATALELPAEAALGAVNLVGLANNHFWRSGCHVSPWGAWPDLLIRDYPRTCKGFALAGFEMYYALLNMGFPLKVSAGSAYGVHPVPVGWSRVYVHVEGGFNLLRWFAGLQRGNSFVTTGPMILLKVNGLAPGEELHGGRFPLPIKIELQMLSLRPVQQAEIIVNGSAHPIDLHPEAGEQYAYRGELALVLRASSWVAARWFARRGNGFDLAHTSPVYFWDGPSRLPVPRAQAEYLLHRVEALIQEAKSNKPETGPGPTTIVENTRQRRQGTLEYFNRALEVYQSKVHQAD